MSAPIPKWLAAVGAALLLAVLIAGCTGTPPSTTPVPPPSTPMLGNPPATTAASPPTLVGTPPVAPTAPAMTTPAAQQAAAVTIKNFAFSPASITVARGTTVTWTNEDAASHTIVNDATDTVGVGKIFSSNTLGNGQTFSFTFNDPGVFPYHCGIHTFMKGTITVA
ncbi:MAG TPA: plastocyanin/azurin family copper-binding protein [Methanomicrobiales archaeon]|nr:plastocyanin/azurin family copper-binding protein [Methanomicrobiales archaeon]